MYKVTRGFFFLTTVLFSSIKSDYILLVLLKYFVDESVLSIKKSITLVILKTKCCRKKRLCFLFELLFELVTKSWGLDKNN